MDLEMLVKLLNLSTSSEDGEALSAIRHANKLIKKHNIPWEKIIHPPFEATSQASSPTPTPRSPRKKRSASKLEPDLDRMFHFLLNESQLCASNATHLKFIQSLFKFHKREKLSKKQAFFIEKYYYQYRKKESNSKTS